MEKPDLTDHIGVGEAAGLDDVEEVSGVVDVPAGDAADALEAVHDVAIHSKRVARLRHSRVVRLSPQHHRDSIC